MLIMACVFLKWGLLILFSLDPCSALLSSLQMVILV